MNVTAHRRASDEDNPFAAARSNFFVDPRWSQVVDSVSATTSSVRIRDTLALVRDVPVAFWISSKHVIRGTETDSVQGLLRAAAVSSSPPPLCVLVLHLLPNRNCHAAGGGSGSGSGSELCCGHTADGQCDYGAGDCAEGLAEYAREVVDALASVLRAQPEVPVALVLEPNAVAALATAAEGGRCGGVGTSTAYRQGLRYAADRLSLPHTALYLDAAHGGWLGWPHEAARFASVVASLGITTQLRGFATNIGRYRPLGTPCPQEALLAEMPLADFCAPITRNHAIAAPPSPPPPPCCRDSCGQIARGARGQNEHNYVQLLGAALQAALPALRPYFVIDTARSGVDDMRSNCTSSASYTSYGDTGCNLRGAGLGVWATASTALPDLIDAYFWLKSPAESDGCSTANGQECASIHSNAACAVDDALGSRAGEPPPPPVGGLYAALLLHLAARAHLQAQDETVLGLRGGALTFGGPPRTGTLRPWPHPPPPAPPPPRCAACGSEAGNALSVLLALGGAISLWLARTHCCGGARGRRRQAKVPTGAGDANALTMLVGSPQQAQQAEEEDEDGDEQDERRQEDDGDGNGEGEAEDREVEYRGNAV